jgi:hypothetical protein
MNGNGNGLTGCQVHAHTIFFSFSLFLTYFSYHVGVGAVPNSRAWHNGHKQDREQRYGLPGALKFFFLTYFLILTAADAVPNGRECPNGDEQGGEWRYGLPGAPKIYFFCFVFFF